LVERTFLGVFNLGDFFGTLRGKRLKIKELFSLNLGTIRNLGNKKERVIFNRKALIL